MICTDYDLCAGCHNQRHAVHPEHDSWKKPGIFCDGCGKKDLAPNERHKCSKCPDFDLCSGCYSRSHEIHPEHDSWKMPGIFCDGCGKKDLAPNERHKCSK